MSLVPTILIVDDEADLRDIYHMFVVNDVDAHFIFASNGAQAIESLKENHVDLIISDYHMPHQNGGEVFLFNSQYKNIPFILVSSGDIKDYPEFKSFFNHNTHNSFLKKTFTAPQLVEKVKLALTPIEH